MSDDFDKSSVLKIAFENKKVPVVNLDADPVSEEEEPL